MAISISAAKRKDRNTIEASGSITHGRQVNATNTGIAGIGVTRGSLTTVAGATYSTNGQTITGKLFTDTVNITGSNITISGCQLEASGASTKGFVVSGNNVTIQDCTVAPVGATSLYMGIHAAGGTGLLVNRCDLTKCENIMTVETSSVTVRESYLHGVSNASNPGGHRDTIELYLGSSFTVQRSKLLHGDNGETAVLNIAPWQTGTDVNGVQVEDNYMDGSIGQILYDNRQSSGPHHIYGLRVVRNDMSGHTQTQYTPIWRGNASPVTIVGTEGAMTGETVLWPTSGADANYWVDCSDLTPDKSGQIIIPAP